MEPLCSSHLHSLLLEPGLRLVESETIRETSCRVKEQLTPVKGNPTSGTEISGQLH